MKNKTASIILTTIFAVASLPILTSAQPRLRHFSVFSQPQNLSPTLNSTENDSGAFVTANGLTLYFSGNRAGGQGSGDIWVSQRETLTSAWGPPQNLGTVINTENNENQPTLSLDRRTMFFNSNRPGGLGVADIYMCTRSDPNDDFSWSSPVNLGPNVNSSDSEIGAGYFEDTGRGTATLYFASDRPGGHGDFDIYQSTRNGDGTFNSPTNVLILNDGGMEGHPQVRSDGLEIIFVSDRTDGGLGGQDIWASTRNATNAPWGPPHIVASINSKDLEVTPSFSLDGSVVYFGSDRDGGSGLIDIYSAVRVRVNCNQPTSVLPEILRP